MSLFVLVGVTVLACATVAVGFSGAARASREYKTTQVNTPTAKPNPAGVAGGSADNAASQASPPAPQSTEEAGATFTAQATGLNSVATGGPSPLPTGESGVGGGAGTVGTTPAGSNGEFPWLIVGGVTVLALAGLLFAAMRGRRPAQTAISTAPPMRRRADMRNLAAPPPGSTEVTAATAATTATVAIPAAASERGDAAAVDTAGEAGEAGAVAPAMVTCPNCGTSNASTEKYCRECGQDLRPVVAQMAAEQAAAQALVPPAPVDVVEADTPYLETLDRVDEQLEFVLSRPRVVIGTAPGNDIVIDAAFEGWQTVSPQHAELRREQDVFVIVDRDSENGTFVNDMRTGENILSDGDLMRLGDVRFYFRVPRGEG